LKSGESISCSQVSTHPEKSQQKGSPSEIAKEHQTSSNHIRKHQHHVSFYLISIYIPAFATVDESLATPIASSIASQSSAFWRWGIQVLKNTTKLQDIASILS
jgi:hypothetical protein